MLLREEENTLDVMSTVVLIRIIILRLQSGALCGRAVHGAVHKK